MEQQTDSQLGKEYCKAACRPWSGKESNSVSETSPSLALGLTKSDVYTWRYLLSCSLCVAWKPCPSNNSWSCFPLATVPWSPPSQGARREQGQSCLTALNVSWKRWVILARGYGTWEEGGLAGRGSVLRVLLGSRLSRGNWGLWLGTLFTT